jgi:hypothetical protein
LAASSGASLRIDTGTIVILPVMIHVIAAS